MYHPMYQQPSYMEGMPLWQCQGYQGEGYQGQYGYPSQQPSSMMQMPPASQQGVMGQMNQMGQLPMEQSYIENILRLNRGKQATVYMTFDGENGENAQQVFTGIVEAAGRDHIILSDPQTGKRYVLLMVYLNYVTFDEEIEYSYPLGQMATYSPR